MHRVFLAILLDGLLEQDHPAPFSAVANCRPFQIIVPPGTEITWDVRLTSLGYPLPPQITDCTVYIIGGLGEDLFQPQTNDATKKLIDEYEIRWTCQRTVNSTLKPGEYVYDISIGHEGPLEKHFYKIDPLLVISG